MTKGAKITDIEDKNFSTNHSRVDYLVAKEWRLDEQQQTVILHSRAFERMIQMHGEYSER